MLLCGITLLLICGDDELNPGPKKTRSYYNFSLCRWNLNSITAHNFSKISLHEAYNVQQKFDRICISETYLDSSFANNDPRIKLPGYNVVTADNPNNAKRGGVSVCFKESLAVRSVTSLCLRACLLLEVFIQHRGYVVFYIDHLVKLRTSLMNFYLTLSNFSLILSLSTQVFF